MSIKISELPSASSVGSSDVIPIVQEGTTKKATAGMISPPIATSITSSSTNSEVAGAKAVYDYCGTLSDIVKLSYFDPLGTGKTISTTKATLASGSFTLKGGTYLVITQPILMKFSTSSYQFNLGLTVDGTDNELYSVAKLNNVGSGQQTEGNINVVSKIDIEEGEHNLIFYGVTNNSSKTVTIPPYASFDIFLIKIGSSTTTLNTASLMNTGSLVGMGDRAELTSLTSELTDNNVGEQEVKEVTPLETTEEKTEGSGDIL